MSLPTNPRSAVLDEPPGTKQRPAPGRRRRWPVWAAVIAVLGVLAVLGGTRLYATSFAPEAPEPLGLSGTSTDAADDQQEAAPPAGPVDVDGSWQVAQGSMAGYRLGEVLSGVQTTVVGRTPDVSGTVTIVDGSLETAEVAVVTETIATDEQARDAYFRRAVGSDEFPQATFVLSAPLDVSGVADATGPVTFTADGTLTFHGVSAPVVAELQVDRSGATPDAIEVVGTIPVVLADYGLQAPDLGFVTVEPSGQIELLLVLTR